MKLFKPKWHVQVTEDVMTSGKIWEVSSPIVKPIECLGFPYDDTNENSPLTLHIISGH